MTGRGSAWTYRAPKVALAAVSAMNARHHGVTGRPDQGLVARYLSVILDRPQITLGDLVAPDDATRQAIVLARAAPCCERPRVQAAYALP